MNDVVLWLIVGALFVTGLAGTILPFLPGTPLIVLGAFVHAVATGWTPVGVGRLALLAILSALGYLLHYAAGALGARKVGGSRWAVIGAIVGAVVGMFFGLPGLILGPPLGAIAGELIKGGDVAASVKAGIATFIGMVAGAVANFAIGVVMLGLFLWWVARG
jgi:uncharacterized protein YqgC (DUF456 family)